MDKPKTFQIPFTPAFSIVHMIGLRKIHPNTKRKQGLYNSLSLLFIHGFYCKFAIVFCLFVCAASIIECMLCFLVTCFPLVACQAETNLFSSHLLHTTRTQLSFCLKNTFLKERKTFRLLKSHSAILPSPLLSMIESIV